MFNRIAIICIVLPFIWGCGAEEPAPEIVYNYPGSSGGFRMPSPTPTVPLPKPTVTAPESWQPLAWAEKGWTAVIIHHSATRTGNAAIFDSWHREGNHWEGVGYDFVIGNGTDSKDGQVEVTYRWRYQKVGAHCGGTPNNWANKEGVGICLVGDFNRTTPTRAQLQSLVKLVSFLQDRFNIQTSRIYGHGSTPGGHTTDCPGKRFPMAELKSSLD